MLRIAPRGATAPRTDRSFIFLFRPRVSSRRESIRSRSEQEIPALVLRPVSPHGAIRSIRLDPKHPRSTLFLLAGRVATVHLTGGGSGQPMQIAARRDGNTPFISPELDPIPQVLASTTMTRSSSGYTCNPD